MKKVLVIVAFYLLVVTPVFAQEEATTPAKPKSKIEEIKEKIASTVAQLNLVSKKGFVGQISKLEKTQITIEKNGEARIVEIDELTKYQELTDKKRTDITFADLDVGDYLVAVGLYNKESRKLLGRFILVKDIPVNINGGFQIHVPMQIADLTQILGFIIKNFRIRNRFSFYPQ